MASIRNLYSVPAEESKYQIDTFVGVVFWIINDKGERKGTPYDRRGVWLTLIEQFKPPKGNRTQVATRSTSGREIVEDLKCKGEWDVNKWF